MTKKIISALLLIVISFSVGVCAADSVDSVDESGIAKIVIEFSEPDENDIIKASFSVYNTTYKGMMVYLSYSKDVIVPVDYETKEPTAEFEKFSVKPTVAKDLETGEDIQDWSTEIGSEIDLEKGELFFTTMVNIEGIPIPNSLITKNKQILVDETGVTVFEFYFEKISDGKIELKPAKEELLKDGLMLVNSGGALPYVLEYKLPESLGESVALYSSPEVKARVSRENFESEEEKDKITDGRAVGTIFLEIGNYATISSRKLKWVDKDNKNIIPYIKNDKTMVPLRYIAEELGAKVSFDDITQVITIKDMNTELSLTLNDKVYYNDGLKREMEVAPEVIDGRTFVSVRFVSEALGREVAWLEKDRIVVVTLKGYPWDENNEIEKTLLTNAKLLMSPMMRDYAY